MLCRTGGVHETTGVDAHFGAPVMHTDRPVLSAGAARSCDVAARSGRGTGAAWAAEGRRPQGPEGLVRARGRAHFHTHAPAPCWGRSPRNYPCGKAV